MKALFVAVILLGLAIPALAKVVEFAPAENWVSVPDDGSGGPFLLLWAHTQGLGQSGAQFFSPVQASTSTLSVSPEGLPPVQVATSARDSFALFLAESARDPVVRFKPAENWVSVPDDGSGGPLVLLWAHPRGLGQSGVHFFSPVEVSTSLFSVTPRELPAIDLAIPEPKSAAWILAGLAICGVLGLRKT
jgi:hypothetical protein